MRWIASLGWALAFTGMLAATVPSCKKVVKVNGTIGMVADVRVDGDDVVVDNCRVKLRSTQGFGGGGGGGGWGGGGGGGGALILLVVLAVLIITLPFIIIGWFATSDSKVETEACATTRYPPYGPPRLEGEPGSADVWSKPPRGRK